VEFVVGLVYHEGMRVPRQEDSLESGRVNQKRRTRAAIVTAAQELLAEGVTPTVAQAAEAAGISRTTAYRYFPTQESLLVEIAVNANVDDIEELVATDVDADSAQERVIAVLDRFNQHTFDAEAQYRTALRLYLDQWLESAAKGEDAPILREGRRRRWYEESLAPLRRTVDKRSWNRLILALSLLGGAEAMVVFRDVCHVESDEARRVARWAAETLLQATFAEHPRSSAT